MGKQTTIIRWNKSNNKIIIKIVFTQSVVIRSDSKME